MLPRWDWMYQLIFSNESAVSILLYLSSLGAIIILLSYLLSTISKIKKDKRD
ncbi:hypothetical protein J2S09_001604 [Bacillus fengqiuensis]|nr:hypothetical protein [Bacillus fengqiuensis]